MERQRPDPQAGSSLDGAANSGDSRAMSRAARQPSSRRPTPASVHNDGRMNSLAGVAVAFSDFLRRDR